MRHPKEFPGQDGNTLVKAAVVLGLLSWLIAPEAVSSTLIGTASTVTIPATLLSLALLTGLGKRG